MAQFISILLHFASYYKENPKYFNSKNGLVMYLKFWALTSLNANILGIIFNGKLSKM